MRAVGGVFVWAIEAVLLSLFAFGVMSIIHVVGVTSPIAMDMWAIFTIGCSCVLNVLMHTLVACSSKQTMIPPVESDTAQGFQSVYLHKAIAQGHCIVATILTTLYALVLYRSMIDLNWASAYYPAAPGLAWITGTTSFSFLTVLWMVSIAGAFAATAVGDTNPLFWTNPTSSVICIMFPILNEIGSNGLMVCSSPMISTLAILYSNIALATSFTLSLLDNVEFDPVRILPKFMRSMGDKTPSFRVYSMLHGLCISATVVMYWIVEPNVGLATTVVLLSVNGAITLSNSFSIINALARTAVDGVTSTSRAPGQDSTMGSDDGQSTVSSSGSSESESGDSDTPVRKRGGAKKTPSNRPSKTPVEKAAKTTYLGAQRRHTLLLQPASYTAARPLVQPGVTGTTRDVSLEERRIAMLRLGDTRNTRQL
jgi:hypothetical protein